MLVKSIIYRLVLTLHKVSNPTEAENTCINESHHKNEGKKFKLQNKAKGNQSFMTSSSSKYMLEETFRLEVINFNHSNLLLSTDEEIGFLME